MSRLERLLKPVSASLPSKRKIPAASKALLPVRICETPSMVGHAEIRRQRKARRTGVIDIDLGHARVRIEGAADPDCVQAALERLMR